MLQEPGTESLLERLSPLAAACAIGAAVFLAALFGILSRPLGFLAAIWPANALLLGLLVLRNRPAGPGSWLAGFLGFMLAGLVTGDGWLTNLWLTLANLGGVVPGYLLLRRLDPGERMLRRPLSVLHVFLVCVVASGSAALMGCGLAPLLFNRPVSTGLAFWFTTELSNYLITLPVLLTAPAAASWHPLRRRPRIPRTKAAAPTIALCLSIAATIAIGGPGSIAFPVPAMLWCSLSYRLFPVSVLMLLSSLALMTAEAAGLLFVPGAFDVIDSTTTFRLGISLLALGPLTVTSGMEAQRRLVARLDLAISRDSLTGTLARGAFLDRSATALREAGAAPGLAVLMIDIDEFKQVNDRHGHAAGDAVLRATADVIRHELRMTDLLGRLGGEEFAVTLASVGPDHAAAIAERLRHSVEQLEVRLANGERLGVTVSIGLAHYAEARNHQLSDVLQQADAALYRAKAEGRNRVIASQLRETSSEAATA